MNIENVKILYGKKYNCSMRSVIIESSSTIKKTISIFGICTVLSQTTLGMDLDNGEMGMDVDNVERGVKRFAASVAEGESPEKKQRVITENEDEAFHITLGASLYKGIKFDEEINKFKYGSTFVNNGDDEVSFAPYDRKMVVDKRIINLIYKIETNYRDNSPTVDKVNSVLTIYCHNLIDIRDFIFGKYQLATLAPVPVDELDKDALNSQDFSNQLDSIELYSLKSFEEYMPAVAELKEEYEKKVDFNARVTIKKLEHIIKERIVELKQPVGPLKLESSPKIWELVCQSKEAHKETLPTEDKEVVPADNGKIITDAESIDEKLNEKGKEGANLYDKPEQEIKPKGGIINWLFGNR